LVRVDLIHAHPVFFHVFQVYVRRKEMKKLTRREMLKVIGVGSVGVVAVACAPAAAPAAEPTKAVEATKAPEATEAPEPTKAPEPTAEPPKAQPVKITMVESWFGIPQYAETLDPVTQAISSAMQSAGVNIEITSMILADHEAKYPLLYASGADFTMAFDAPWYKMDTLRTQNALVTIEGLVKDKSPNLYAEITEKIFNANLIDGKLYGIPAGWYYGGTGGTIYREDLRVKYDVPVPTAKDGWASLEPYLDAVMKGEPTMLPFGNVTTQSMTGYVRAHPAWGANGNTKTGVGIPDITKDYVFTDSEDDSFGLEQAQRLRSWWEKGYINKTDLTFSGSSQNAQIDYLYPGKISACVENEPNYKWVDQNKQMKSSSPDAELRGVEMTGATAGLGKSLGQLKQWNFIVYNASAPQEQIDAGVAYFDWLASSQDNMDMWLMGLDGVNYKKEEGLRFSEVEGVDNARNYRRMWYVSGLSGRFQRQPLDLPKEAEDALKFFSTEENWLFTPYEAFQPDLKALEVETSKLNAVYDEAVHGWNTGQEPTEQAAAKMKKMLDEAGRQEYKAKLQKQLDDYIAANS
jgi:putative aldouronate transport system substrate-binding protein